MESREIVPSQAYTKLRGGERGMDGQMKTEMDEAMKPKGGHTERDPSFVSSYWCTFEGWSTVLLPYSDLTGPDKVFWSGQGHLAT